MRRDKLPMRILISLFFISSTIGIECNSDQYPEPPSIPIQNVTIADGGVRRGLAVSFGSPPQTLALQANVTANNTYTFDGSTLNAKVCTTSSLEVQCATEIGGAFDESSSQNWSGLLSFADSGASSESVAGGNLWGQDTVWLNISYTPGKLPIGLYEGKSFSTNMNDFGLGHNSTILNSLFNSGAIVSKVWSMWQGWTGANTDHQMDGSVVLGGYDAAKFVGPNLTTPITYSETGENSPLIVTVTEIVMNLADGTNQTIFGSSTQPVSFQAQILPTAPLITVFDDTLINFAQHAGGKNYTPPGESSPRAEGYTHSQSMLYEAAGVYTGDLTFTIASQLQIRIPNHQLVLPDYTINEQGQQEVTNSSLADILLYQLAGGDTGDFPILGQPFLTSAYLMVDYDNSQFHLWQSNPSPKKELIAVGPANCDNTSSSSSTGSGSSPISSNPASPSRTEKKKHALAGGAIAGIIVGALAVLALLACLIYFLIKRGKAVPSRDGSEKSSRSSNPGGEDLDQLPRQELEWRPPGEMDGHTVKPRVEIDGREVPGWELEGNN